MIMNKELFINNNFEETEFIWRKEINDVFLKYDKITRHWYLDGKLISPEKVEKLL